MSKEQKNSHQNYNFVLLRTPQSEKLHILGDVIANSVFEKRFVYRIFEELIQVKKKKVLCHSVQKKNKCPKSLPVVMPT